ncbi:MAG: prepilin-type N-terminal cleavage/methylation domain-containing protein, partial [Oscillospiraceae bacterium]|nr:prepilin-type N-terminal cleavage/methylation domain-containing protein [Oscillospiraceae bacterium]
MKRAKKGFTLIEVICVLVIIAIVAVIAVPSITKYIDNSKINNCKSTMNSFINDLEYKIVSRRYYDVDELNRELVGVVDEASVEMNSSMVPVNEDGKFKSLTENITETTGICPNGGHYTINWVITPGGDENPNTAKVKLASCVCDCMNDDDRNVQLSSEHEFTASLISRADYLKSMLSEEDTYKKEIQKIIDYINENLKNPSQIYELIQQYESENPNSQYKVMGVTVKENQGGNGESKWVEWICVDQNKNYDASLDPNDKSAHDVIVY